jgi:hypothetical protein
MNNESNYPKYVDADILEQRLKKLKKIYDKQKSYNNGKACKCLRRSIPFRCECCMEFGTNGCDNIRCHAYDPRILEECKKCHLLYSLHQWIIE